MKKKIPVKTPAGVKWLEEKRVARFEANGNYTYVLLSDNTRLLSTSCLKHYTDLLHRKNFYRVHDKHLLNINCEVEVRKSGKNSWRAITPHAEVDISVRKRAGFVKFLNGKEEM